MPEHVWTMACQDVVVDSRSNRVTLVHVLEQLQGPSEAETLGVVVHLISLWKKSVDDAEEAFEYRVRWVDGDGQELRVTRAFEVIIPEDSRRHRTISRIAGLPIEQPGIYSFEVECSQAHEEFHVVSGYEVEIGFSD